MALSKGLIRCLESHSNNEPLAKRLKLAENVFYSSDVPIVCKEECIFRWLCSNLSNQDNNLVWKSIYRCLSIEPKNFTKFSLKSKNTLIEKLINNLNNYPQSPIVEEMLKCCNSIFSNIDIHYYMSQSNIIDLLKSLLLFTTKVFNHQELGTETKYIKDLALDTSEYAINYFSLNYRSNCSERNNLIMIFIKEILFPLSSLLETIRVNNISSKLFFETQKFIKKLLLMPIKSNHISMNEEKKENEIELFFNILKTKSRILNINDIKITFTYLFQCAVNYFKNSVFLDIVLRKLIECTEQKEGTKQVLISLLESSTDVCYNYSNEINGITLQAFLDSHIKNVISKKKSLKCSDYELVTSIAKINPIIIEDVIQIILEKILFEEKICESKSIAFSNLVTELWKASVRLRRHHKFVSKFLLTICKHKEHEIDINFVNEFQIPQNFILAFNKDLESNTTSAQALAIFHSLIFHLKADCISKLKLHNLQGQVYLSTKIITNFIVSFFEHAQYLDNSLPHTWQTKFYQAFIDFTNLLTLFAEGLCEIITKDMFIILENYSKIIKVWCEVYDLLCYYVPNIIHDKLEFPVNEIQLKKLKQTLKSLKDESNAKPLNQIILFKSVIYDRNTEHLIKENIITYLWTLILEDHFQIIETFDESQLLNLAFHLVNEISYSQEALIKWIKILKQNISRISQRFTMAVCLQIYSNILKDIKQCTSKTIVEKTNFINVLKSLDDPDNHKKVFKQAKIEFAKHNFVMFDITDVEKIKNNLTLLSNLPVSFLDTNVRIFLFIFLYTIEKEININIDFCLMTTNLYFDFLQKNDVDILSISSKPEILVNHFKSNILILSKLLKQSLNIFTTLKFWNDFIDKDNCDMRISCILLTCIDNLKYKTFSIDHKNALQNLVSKLINKITILVTEEVNNSDEIAGLKICLKIILLEKKEIQCNFKKCIEQILIKKTQNLEIADNKILEEYLQLSLIVLSNREYFDINHDIVRFLCIILIKNPDEKIFCHFLEVLKDDEFEYFAKFLSNETKKYLVNDDASALENVLQIWESLSTVESKSTRSTVLSLSVNNLLNNLLTSEFEGVSYIFILKMCQAFISSKRIIRLSNKIVDSIFVSANQCFDKLTTDIQLSLCKEALGVGLALLRSKSEFLLDRLPMLTNLFRKIITSVLQNVKDTKCSDQQILKIIALDIEKFCIFFAKLKKNVVRISPYLIADIIDTTLYVGVLPPFLKASIDSSIFHILSNCDRHAVSFLSRILPASKQQVFKTIYENYVKYYKFTGKI